MLDSEPDPLHDAGSPVLRVLLDARTGTNVGHATLAGLMPPMDPNGIPREILRRCILCAVLIVPATSLAQPQPTPPLKPPSSESRGMPALARILAEATLPIMTHGGGAVVVGAPLESDTPAPRGTALVQRVVALVAGAIGPSSRAVHTPMSLDEARAETASSPTLAFVHTRIANGQLSITIDIHTIPRNIWDRARSGSPGPIVHGFGSARLDAEIRSFLAPVPLVARNPIKVPLPEPDVLALACEDIDDDGALDLLLISRRTVASGTIRKGRFSPDHQVAWSSISPIASSPWREPLATVLSNLAYGWDVGLTDRAHSVRLDPQLKPIATYEGMPVLTLGPNGCAQRRVSSLSAEIGPCLPTDPSPSTSAPFPFDASASDLVIGTDGGARAVWAIRSPTDGTLSLRDDRGNQHALPNVGAQIALADVDLDGDPDLVASKNVLNPANDALVLRSWRRNGTLEKRAELSVSDGIAALTVCPPDGPGQRIMVLATPKELWILR